MESPSRCLECGTKFHAGVLDPATWLDWKWNLKSQFLDPFACAGLSLIWQIYIRMQTHEVLQWCLSVADPSCSHYRLISIYSLKQGTLHKGPGVRSLRCSFFQTLIKETRKLDNLLQIKFLCMLFVLLSRRVLKLNNGRWMSVINYSSASLKWCDTHHLQFKMSHLRPFLNSVLLNVTLKRSCWSGEIPSSTFNLQFHWLT